MRPKTTREELPTRATVRTNIKNEFVDYMGRLRESVAAAPGDISTNWDLWTEEHASLAYFGLIGQWIDVTAGEWDLRCEVLAFHKISGEHTGKNLGRYFVKFTDRAGITSKRDASANKLGHITADNTSNNDTTAKELEAQLRKRGVEGWNADDRKLGCISHVVQLGIEDFMGEVTKVGVIENKQAIWDYDPTLPENGVVCGGLDVIAVIRTLAIKIQASPQRKEAFERYQKQFGFEKPLVIPLHGNTRWGSALGMCERAYKLREAINAFVATAQDKFGPISIIRKDGKVVKKIPWLAFRLEEADWRRVALCTEILADADRYLQHFSSERIPTLHRVIPALEALCTRWEKKLGKAKYSLYHPALKRGLEKLGKYYRKLDHTGVYILSLLLHPYYKLAYIAEKWGGAKEQEEEIAAGNPDAINWQALARQVTEEAMEAYWPKRLGQAEKPQSSSQEAEHARRPHGATSSSDEDEDDYDRTRTQRLQAAGESGWQAELERYLKDPAADVKKDTDTIWWWSKHVDTYPTLARMALDILPIPASSVAAERLFSSAKEVSTARRSRLGADVFEWIECLAHHWARDVVDYARLNSDLVEEYDLDEFLELCELDDMLRDDKDEDLSY